MISQTDIIVYEALRLGLQDIRENIWLIDDIFSVLKNNQFVASQFGESEIAAIKNWFSNTDIPVLLKYRVDKETFPCVTVSLGGSQEKPDMKHLADLSTEIDTILPSIAQKPISYIVKPFVPTNINTDEHYITVPDNVSLRGARAGQTLVDVDNGIGTIITKIEQNKIYYKPISTIFSPSRAAIAPQFPFYKARREHTFFQESVSIGCHAAGDPIQAIWLSSIIIYTILRFRETLLEGKYYTQSMISISELVPNEEYGGVASDLVYSRYITMTGQIEYSWLKGLKRIVEKVELEDHRNDDDIRPGIIYTGGTSEDTLTEDQLPPISSDDALWVSWPDKDSEDSDNN